MNSNSKKHNKRIRQSKKINKTGSPRDTYSVSMLCEIAKERGGEFLSDEYKGVNTPHLWRCKKGHEWLATPASINRMGTWCNKCNSTKKYTIEEMHKYAESKGGKCLSPKYINIKTKLNWKCKCGHDWLATPDNVIRGKWCPKCAGKLSTTKESILELCEARGLKYISGNIKDIKSKIVFQCEEGHKFESSIASIKNSIYGCPKCIGRGRTIHDLRDAAKRKKGKLLSNKFEGMKYKYEWQCEKGHKWKATGTSILGKRDTWCPNCRGVKRWGIKDCQNIAKRRNGKLLSNIYTNPDLDLEWECEYGHTFKKSLSKITNRNQWCPFCNVSFGENYCRLFLEELFGLKFNKFRSHDLRGNKGGNLEIDGFCKEINLAFEHQGYQHYRKSFRDKDKSGLIERKKNDDIKKKWCDKNGIKLLYIPEITTMIKLDEFPEFLESELLKHEIKIPKDIKSIRIPIDKIYLQKGEDLRAYANKHNGTVILKNRTKNGKIEFLCDKNHLFHLDQRAIHKGRWCPKCRSVVPLSIKVAQDEASSRGGICLDKTYKNSQSKLTFQCKKGHIFLKSLGKIRSANQWCPYCNGSRKYPSSQLHLFE